MCAMRVIGGGDDPFARYKIPELEIKHEGRGKMLLTCVTNLCDVMDDLNRDETAQERDLQPVRDEEAFLKYVAMKKGATVRLVKLAVSGRYTKQELTALLDEFIATFFLCSHCGNPETNVHFGRGMSLYCRACCNRSDIKGNHKFVDWLQKKARKMTSALGGKGAKRATKETSSSSAVTSRAAEEDAELAEGIEDLLVSLATEDHDLVAEFSSFVAAHPTDSAAQYIELLRLQDEFRLSTLDTWRLLVRTLFSAVEPCAPGGSMEALKEVYQQHRFLFQELAKGGMEAEEMLLEALRLDLPKVDPAHPGPFVHLAHAMYDADVLSEEAFLVWECRKGVQQSPLHAALVPFLQWLKLTAEEESDSD